MARHAEQALQRRLPDRARFLQWIARTTLSGTVCALPANRQPR